MGPFFFQGLNIIAYIYQLSKTLPQEVPLSDVLKRIYGKQKGKQGKRKRSGEGRGGEEGGRAKGGGREGERKRYTMKGEGCGGMKCPVTSNSEATNLTI